MNEQRKRIVEHNRLESLKAWKQMNENSRIINSNNVGDGGTGSGGSFEPEPDPNPEFQKTKAWSNIGTTAGGTYGIWIVGETSNASFSVDTGFPASGSTSEIVPIQNGGFMYVLGGSNGTKRVIYYKTDGTLVYD